MLSAGVHAPLIAGELVELVGNAGILAPAQYAVGVMLNVGFTIGLIVIVVVAVLAHCPTVGVKV